MTLTTFLKGTFASRPSAASNPDTFYWASDLPTAEDLFFSDGNTWVVMGEQPFEPLERSAISQVQGLTEALANFALEDHDHVWADVTGKPSTFPPEAHGHGIADVTGLQAGLDSKAAGSHSHSELPSPGQKNALEGSQGTPGTNNRFLTETDPARTDARVPTAHTHPWDTGVTGKPSTFPPDSHSHPTAQVTGLDAALAAKANLASGKVPTGELGGAGADNTKFLRGDQTWVAPAGGSATTIRQKQIIEEIPFAGTPLTMTPTAHLATAARIIPFEIGGNLTVNRIFVKTAAALANALQVAVFNSAGTRIINSGTVATVNGWTAITVASVAMVPGNYYWATTNAGLASTTAAYHAIPALGASSIPRWGTVVSVAGAMPASIDPTAITEAYGAAPTALGYVVLSEWTT